MTLADAITSETSVSVSLIMTALGLMLTAGVMAIVASVTTRNKVEEQQRHHQSLRKEFEDFRTEARGDTQKQRDWRETVNAELAVNRDRQARSRSGVYSKIRDEE